MKHFSQMYKVFYNEKCITLSDHTLTQAKNLIFQNESQFDEAIALLQNKVATHVNIFDNNVQKLWEKFQNHFKCIEAAGGLVTNSNGEILFIHRFDKWDLPKGKLEKGESVEIVAVREVEEECGISAPEIQHFITNTYHIYFDQQSILKSTYWFRMNYNGNEVLIPQLEEGIGKALWVDPKEIDFVKAQTYANIKLVLEAENF